MYLLKRRQPCVKIYLYRGEVSAAEERTIVKKLRQFAGLVLTVAMAVSLCACGGTKKAESKKLKVGIS